MRAVGPWPRRLEIALVVATLAAAGGVAIVEVESPVAGALRSGRALVGMIALEGGPDAAASSFLAIYHPWPRSLAVLEAPPAKGDALRAIDPDGKLPALDFTLRARLRSPAPSSAAALREWIAGWPRGLPFWIEAARAAGLPLYARVLLALEAYRLGTGEIRPVRLPAPALRSQLLELLLAPAPPPAEPAQLRCEILNASGEAGVALRATKVLRSHEVDVMDYGNAPTRTGTRLVDRAARPRDARRVAELLGCPDAEVSTEFEPRAQAPLAVLLGQDFRRCRRL